MERSEKRRLDRERQKLQKHNLKEDQVNRDWYSSLPVSKKIFIGKFIEKQAIKNDNLVAMIMDKCILGAIDDNTDLSDVLMKKIIKEGNDYILEYKEYLDKYGDGGFDMIENEELRNKVKIKIRQYIKGKMQKNKAIKLLKGEFNIPDAELSNLWISCKSEGTRDEKNIKTALEYKEKGKEIKMKKDVKAEVAIDKEGITVNDTVGLTITDDENVLKGPHTTSKLKVMNIIREIQGEYGMYVVSNKGVKINGQHYNNVIDVKKDIDKLVIQSDESLNLIKVQMDELENEMNMIKETTQRNIKKYDEIIEVFNS